MASPETAAAGANCEATSDSNVATKARLSIGEAYHAGWKPCMIRQVLSSPPQPRRGGCAAKKKSRSHLSPRRRGGADQENDSVDQHHPSRRYRVGFPLLG